MPSELIRELWPDAVIPERSRAEILRQAILQLNKDLAMSGTRYQVPSTENPLALWTDLTTWMKTAPPSEVIRFLYRLDVPETLVAEGPEKLARRCLQRALMKVWLRTRASSGT